MSVLPTYFLLSVILFINIFCLLVNLVFLIVIW